MSDFTNQGLSPMNQGLENPYIIVPEDNSTNRLTIKKAVFITFAPLFAIILFTGGLCAFLVINKMPYLTALIVIPIFLLLFFCKSRIVLIKDRANNRLTVQEKNYFCCTTKTYNIPFAFSDIKTGPCGSESGPCCYHVLSRIFVLNADPNIKDIDNNNIKNTPFKFMYKFSYLIGSEQDLQINLMNFIGTKFNNNIEEEINLYVPNRKELPNINFNISFPFFQKKTDTLIKVSDHFYILFNYPYLYTKSTNESFERLDWIYTNDFDRIFLGVVKNDKSYVNTFIYNIESIDKFILEIRDGKLCLKILLKNGINNEICRYTRQNERDLDTFIYLINGQINKINNNGNNNGNNNEVLPEKPLETNDNSSPTIV